MKRSVLTFWFVRLVSGVLLAGALAACGALFDLSEPTLDVTVVDNGGSEFRVEITARDPESGVKSVEVLAVNGAESTSVYLETFTLEDDTYPLEVSVEALVPATTEQIVVLATNAFGLVGESTQDVTPNVPSVTRLRVTPSTEVEHGSSLEVWVNASSGVDLVALELSVLINGSGEAEPLEQRPVSGTRVNETFTIDTSVFSGDDEIVVLVEAIDVRERVGSEESDTVWVRPAPPEPESEVTIDALVLNPSTTLLLDGTLRVRVDASSDVPLSMADLYVSVNDGPFDWFDDQVLSNSVERVVFDLSASAFSAGDRLEVRVDVRNGDGKSASRMAGPVELENAPESNVTISGVALSPSSAVEAGEILRVRVDASSDVSLSLADLYVSKNNGPFEWVMDRMLDRDSERVVFDFATTGFAGGDSIEVRVEVQNVDGVSASVMAGPVSVTAEDEPDASIEITSLLVQPASEVMLGEDLQVRVDVNSGVRLTLLDAYVSRNGGPFEWAGHRVLSQESERMVLDLPTSSYANNDVLEVRVVAQNVAGESESAMAAPVSVKSWEPALVYVTPSITSLDATLLVSFDADIVDAGLSVTVRVQGEAVSQSAIEQLADPKQWQVSVKVDSFTFDVAAQDELLVSVTLTRSGQTRSLTEVVDVNID